MDMIITPSGKACGAMVSNIDLSIALKPEAVEGIRAAWLQHQVLCFPGQQLDDDQLEQFSQHFGPFGEDPFIAPIAGREHIIAVQRKAKEQAAIFADAWHTDWSFQPTPPAGTCLYGITIPPAGGDTLFINQQKALANMPEALRQRIEGRRAIHSARAGYAPEGLYGEADGSDRSMKIISSTDALETQSHPLIISHPETGEQRLFGCLGYIIGIESLGEEESLALLLDLYAWQTREEFQYCHQWQQGMLLMWDNRSVLHRATGGFEGYDRLLHRTTIGERSPSQ
jgi:taurine dioxygenase